MQPVNQTPKHELVAIRLRAGMGDGRWGGSLPGVLRLAAELDVSPHTVRRALRLLEADGLITKNGLGRSRNIATDSSNFRALKGPLRVAILRHDANLEDSAQTTLVLIGIRQSLEAAGHSVFFCKKSQIELKHDARRMKHQLTTSRADAWVVETGSRELLEWCSIQATPSIVLYGRYPQLSLARAALDYMPAFRATIHHLLALGHRRIVFIVRASHRLPTLGLYQRTLLEELTAHGVPTGDYNLPDWEETPRGFTRLLETLFQSTPPTAMIVDESPRFLATLAFCARHGIRVPEHVSLVSTGYDVSLDWCHPGMAQMKWDNTLIVRRVVRWMNAVRYRTPDRKVIKFPVEFVPGGSTGPVWKGRELTIDVLESPRPANLPRPAQEPGLSDPKES